MQLICSRYAWWEVVREKKSQAVSCLPYSITLCEVMELNFLIFIVVIILKIFFKNLFILFLAALVLHCFTGLLTAVASPAAEHGLQAHGPQQLWHMGLVTPRHVGSPQTRARTRVRCTGRWIPNHCATREVPYCCHFNCSSYFEIYDLQKVLLIFS